MKTQRRAYKLLFAALLGSVLLAACARKADVKKYELVGEVVSLDQPAQDATIKHQAIPGFMEAMTMPYHVKSKDEFATLKPGEHIRADLVVTRDSNSIDAWIENIQEQPAEAAPQSEPQAGSKPEKEPEKKSAARGGATKRGR